MTSEKRFQVITINYVSFLFYKVIYLIINKQPYNL